MTDLSKTKAQLIHELQTLRQRISYLEGLEAGRLRVEEALRESEARWRSLTHNSPDQIIILDKDLNIQFANYALPGFTLDELIGTPLYAYVVEKEQAEIKAILENVVLTGQPGICETEYHTPHIMR